MSTELTPLAAAILSLLRGEDGPLDLSALWGAMADSLRYGAYQDLDPAGITMRAVRGALGSLIDAGYVAVETGVGGCPVYRWTPVVAPVAAADRQGSLFGA